MSVQEVEKFSSYIQGALEINKDLCVSVKLASLYKRLIYEKNCHIEAMRRLKKWIKLRS